MQIFCAINECDNDSKKWCFLLKYMVTKKCDTNKNVIKMGTIIKKGLLYYFVNLLFLS